MRFEADNLYEPIVIELANGEEIHIVAKETMGVEGYELKVFASRDSLVVKPSSGNTIVVTTPRAMAILDRKTLEVIAERDKNKPKKGP